MLNYFFLLLISVFSFKFHAAQQRLEFQPGSLSEEVLARLQDEFAGNKNIPSEYRQQILIALSFFPELKNTAIDFRIRHTDKAPLTTVPGFWSLWKKPMKRTYVITIRNMRSKTLQPILFENLPFNAQIGVIGHELSHVTDFQGQTFLQLIWGGIQHISYRYIDRFEFKTDSICVAHGLGYQLLAWSEYVRQSLHRNNWIGAGSEPETCSGRERYMNPSTILKRIQSEPVYQSFCCERIGDATCLSIKKYLCNTQCHSQLQQ